MVDVTDDFERANIDGDWINGIGAYQNTEIANSSELRTITAVGAAAAKRDAESFADDQYSEGEVETLTDDSRAWCQIHVRFQADAECYVLSAHSLGDGTVDILLEHNDGADGFTAIGSTVNVSGTGNAGDLLRLEARGTELKCFWKGVLRKTETDATLSSGKPGCGFFIASGGSIDFARWESWAGGDLVDEVLNVVTRRSDLITDAVPGTPWG